MTDRSGEGSRSEPALKAAHASVDLNADQWQGFIERQTELALELGTIASRQRELADSLIDAAVSDLGVEARNIDVNLRELEARVLRLVEGAVDHATAVVSEASRDVKRTHERDHG